MWVKLTPKPDYPYSETYESFSTEVSRFAKLHDLNETTVGTAYYELINAFYYMVTAMGMTDKTSSMKSYLEDYGIAVPTKPNATEKAEIAGVYAVLKYNAPYVLYEKDVTLPKGTTLEGAEVALISELMDVFLPSGINTVNGLAGSQDARGGIPGNSHQRKPVEQRSVPLVQGPHRRVQRV